MSLLVGLGPWTDCHRRSFAVPAGDSRHLCLQVGRHQEEGAEQDGQEPHSLRARQVLQLSCMDWKFEMMFPQVLDNLLCSRLFEDNVVSGMRRNCDLLIYVDLEEAIKGRRESPFVISFHYQSYSTVYITCELLYCAEYQSVCCSNMLREARIIWFSKFPLEQPVPKGSCSPKYHLSQAQYAHARK